MWHSFVSTIRSHLQRRRFETELDEELQDHLSRDIAHRTSLGASPAEARRAALAELGGVERVKDEMREAHRVDRLDDLASDLRYAARRVRRATHYSALVVLTIALGVGAATAVFSAVDGVLLKPLPYADPDALVTLWQTRLSEGIQRDDVAPGNFIEWRARSTLFTQLAAASPSSANLRSSSTTEVAEAWLVSDGLLQLAGVAPLLGRTFRSEDFHPNAAPVAILDHGFWQRRFGGDSNIVGTALTLDEQPVTIVGVMPPGFSLPEPTNLWRPWAPDEEQRADRFGTYIKVIGRLRPGVTPNMAATEMAGIARRLEQEYPRSNTGVGIALVPLVDVLVGAQRPLLWTLLVASALLVLVALANIAALHLTRVASQRREAAVRVALGGTRLRLARPLVAEALLLAALGGAASLAVAWGGVRVLHALGPQDLPRLADIRLDWRATSAALALACCAAIMLAVLSVARLRDAGAKGALGVRTAVGTRSSMRTRRAAVAAQLALALVLLIGSSLLVTSFRRVLSAERGYRTDHVLSFTTWIYDEYPDPAARERFVEESLDRLGALAGVETAAVGSALPLADQITGEDADVVPEGLTPAEGEEPQSRATVVSPGYFGVLGMTLRSGRLFSPADDARAEGVVVVNEAFARRFFPGRDPIGRTLRVGLMQKARPRVVVGVVGDTRRTRLDAPPEPSVYIPWAQQPLAAATFVLRTVVDPASLARPVSRTMFALDPRVGVARLSTLDALLDQGLRERRFLLVLVGAFAVIAVTLASIGVFGVMSQTVIDRGREIGVRMALGARPGTILSQFLGEAARMTAVGIVAGLAFAAIATQGIARFLFEVRRFDAFAVGSAVVLVMLLALAASALPTLRAARTNPARAIGDDG
jgi:putative ABC transport system permease protein